MKRSLAVSLAAVLIFGLMGFGFAMWSDTVSIGAAVETGNVAIGIGNATSNDPGENPDPNIEPGDNSEGKHVASTDVEYTEAKFTFNGEQYYQGITVDIDNAYPFYAPTVSFDIISGGTIPIKLDDWKIVGIENPELISKLVYGEWTATYPEYTYDAAGVGTKVDKTISGTAESINDVFDALCMTQLHEGDTISVEIQVSFPQDDSIMGQSGSFEIVIHGAQWNEAGQEDPEDW